MNELTLGFIFIVFGGALPCIVIGFLIAVKQQRKWIAGWDESRFTHPIAYANLLGAGVLALGVILAVIGFAWLRQLVDETGLSIAILIASLVPLACVAIANKKYR